MSALYPEPDSITGQYSAAQLALFELNLVSGDWIGHLLLLRSVMGFSGNISWTDGFRTPAACRAGAEFMPVLPKFTPIEGVALAQPRPIARDREACRISFRASRWLKTFPFRCHGETLCNSL